MVEKLSKDRIKEGMNEARTGKNLTIYSTIACFAGGIVFLFFSSVETSKIFSDPWMFLFNYDKLGLLDIISIIGVFMLIVGLISIFAVMYYSNKYEKYKDML